MCKDVSVTGATIPLDNSYCHFSCTLATMQPRIQEKTPKIRALKMCSQCNRSVNFLLEREQGFHSSAASSSVCSAHRPVSRCNAPPETYSHTASPALQPGQHLFSSWSGPPQSTASVAHNTHTLSPLRTLGEGRRRKPRLGSCATADEFM